AGVDVGVGERQRTDAGLGEASAVGDLAAYGVCEVIVDRRVASPADGPGKGEGGGELQCAAVEEGPVARRAEIVVRRDGQRAAVDLPIDPARRRVASQRPGAAPDLLQGVESPVLD